MAKKQRKQDKKPLANGSNGRNEKGQFELGNTFGKGNLWQQDKFRNFQDALLGAVSTTDLIEIVNKQVGKAKAGDNFSAQLILNYCCGKPKEKHELVHSGEIGLRFEEWLKEIDGSGVRSPFEQIRGELQRPVLEAKSPISRN